MKYLLFHVWGPFAIHSYGVCIALAIIVFTYALMQDRRFVQLELEERFAGILGVGIAATLFGGRILYLLSESSHTFVVSDLFNFWQGGLSILGGIIGILAIVPWYIHYLKIPLLPFFDLVAIYSGLLQAIARIGCFFAGCCFGKTTLMPWAIIYNDPLCAAPLHVPLHPAQLYSAAFSLGIFIIMKVWLQHIFTKPGQLTCMYIMFTTLERFTTDFWRADRIMTTHYVSYNQLVALGLGTLAGIIFVWITQPFCKRIAV